MIREKIVNVPPITGINPFDELPIDAAIWRTAHDHHHEHRLLHASLVHRPGIVYGLEVLARGERTVVVAPGAVVDGDGRLILLQEPVSFEMDEKGQFYITISYKQPFISESALTVGSGEKYYEFLEGREVRNTKDAPGGEAIELARIWRSNPEKPVKNAANPFDPGGDEINLLHRPVAFPHCYADVAVGELAYVPKSSGDSWKPNRAGLWSLLHEGNGRGFHLEFAGPVNITADPLSPFPALLYIAGGKGFQPLSAQQVDGLQRFLDRGGVLLGDAGGEEFANQFKELATQLGAPMTELAAGHPLLKSHYVFSAAPAGALDGKGFFMDEAGSVLLSTANYGAAWQGDISKPGATDARERIRQAIEFGLNIVVHAAKRLRGKYLETLVR
ncbi:MAG: DUF4159 domain-containing protein [Armatimonadota bacterium]